ncbi:MAG: DUF4139 domain-containing protein [Calditrichaeota bacterium]|nr:DUF4139 domain-containing protein [Calditrichota bacterium]
MGNRLGVYAGLLTAVLLGWATAALAGSVRVVVYSDGFAFVEEERPVVLSKGRFETVLRNLPAQMDSRSVQLHLPRGVDLLDFSVETPPADANDALELVPGDSVVVLTRGEQVLQGRLVLLDGGNVVLQRQGSVVRVPAGAVVSITNPHPKREPCRHSAVHLRAQSSRAGKETLTLRYLTSGLSWEAVYAATVSDDHKKLQFESTVFLANHSGRDYHQASLVLVAGKPRTVRKETPFRPTGVEYELLRVQREISTPEGFEEKPVYEYHQYTLGRAIDLPDGTDHLAIPFLPAVTFKSWDQYVYDGQYDKKKVRATLVFRNTARALPGGVVRVFGTDDKGNLALLGESQLGHTPKGEKVNLFLGYAFDLVGNRVQVSSKRLSKTVRQETWRITVRNHKSEPVSVTVREHAYGDWQIVRCSESWKRVSARTFEIPLVVPASGENSVTYTIEFR